MDAYHEFSMSAVGTAMAVGAVLGALSTVGYDYAIGKSITVGDVVEGAIAGAVVGATVVVAPVLVFPLTLFGAYQAGALTVDVWLNPMSTPGQKLMATVFLATAFIGPVAAENLAGDLATEGALKKPTINDLRLLHDSGVDDLCAWLESIGVEVIGREIYVRNRYYRIGRRYDIVIKDPKNPNDLIAIEYKGTDGAYDAYGGSNQARADGWIQQNGGLVFGSAAEAGGIAGRIISKVIVLHPN